jgi:hypothetical protein
MGSDFIIFFIVFGLGIMIGLNHRGFRNHDYKKQLLDELDTEIARDLKIAQNLNESLKMDLDEAKTKIRQMERNK